MIGLIQKILIDLVEEKAGVEAVKKVKEQAGVPLDKTYRIGVVYSDEEWKRLLAAALEVLNVSEDQAIEAYADMFGRDALVRFSKWFKMSANSREFLEWQIIIHNVFASGVRDPGARKAVTDKFLIEKLENKIITHYRSPNKLCKLYRALASWMVNYYGDKVIIEEKKCMHLGDEECEIHVIWPNLVMDQNAGSTKTLVSNLPKDLFQLKRQKIPKNFREKESHYFTHEEEKLRAAIDDIADQLGVTVDGQFDFTVKAATSDETLDKLAMLINFVVENARRALSQLEERNAKLAELDHMKSIFLANISHELRTPLALILGPTERWLNSGSLTEGQYRDFEVVMRNARSLLKTVNDLLDVSKLEAGKLTSKYVRADLAKNVRLVGSLFEGVARDRKITYSLETPPLLLGEFDPEMIQRVVLNLLSNAFKFSPDKGKIDCSLALGAEGAVLKVQDSGPGIPKEMRERIFERFMQIEGDSTRKHGGTGLGLAIVREFVELHQGTIEATDAPGGGALFIVKIPLKAPIGTKVEEGAAVLQEREDLTQTLPTFSPPPSSTVPALSLIDELRTARPSSERENGLGKEEEGTSASYEKGLILVVEDNLDMNQFITDTLSEDYHVISTFNGREGLQKALKYRPDLILSDIMMPEMSGDQMVAEIRRHNELDNIPIILLSAKADDELRIKLLRKEAQDYVMKPFAAEEVKARIRNLISCKRARDFLKRELDSSQEDLEELVREVSLRRHELEKALEETQASRDEVQRLLYLRDEFISVAGHELKTPLTPLSLQCQMLQRMMNNKATPAELKEKKVQDYIEMSLRQINTLATLIETLLDLSRIRLGSFSIRPTKGVDLGAVVHQVVERFRAEWEQAQAPVDVQIDSSFIGEWDQIRIEQAISNLLGNAIKYGKGRPIKILITNGPLGARIAVNDQGMGIPKEDQNRIFNRFERVGSIKSFGGLGLGLYITRQIIEAHGGMIRVESEPSQRGSTFIIELPLNATIPD